MEDFGLLQKAWKNLIRTLEHERSAGEIVQKNLADFDEKRRMNGKPVEGRLAEYCRCGKKDCPDLTAGLAGHTLRWVLHTKEGTLSVRNKEVEAYKRALEFNKLYHDALRDLQRYAEICEKVYRALGYCKKGEFERYLKSYS